MIREIKFSVSEFDPERVKHLCDAYDLTMLALQDSGQTEIEPEIVALHIITLAKQGVSDPKSLCTRTLRKLAGKGAVISDPKPTAPKMWLSPKSNDFVA